MENQNISHVNAAIDDVTNNGSDLHGHSASYDSLFNSIPPGYRFEPTNEELVVSYLKRKIDKEPLPPNRINDVDLYKFSPDELTDAYKKDGHDDQKWYFFTERNKKYPNGRRPNRAGGGGYWKATGSEKPVELGEVLIGLRTSLDFYTGKSPDGVRTDWKMHEFKVPTSKDDTTPSKKANTNNMKLEDLVLCRIYKRRNNSKASIQSREQNYGNNTSQETDQHISDEVEDPPENRDEQTSHIFNRPNDMGYGGTLSAEPLQTIFSFHDPHQFGGYKKRQRFCDLPSEFDDTNFDQWLIDVENGLPSNLP